MDDKTIGQVGGESLKPQDPLIFLSYANEDKKKVRAIHRKLRNEQLKPWIDVADILPGQEWDKTITNAIRSARFVIVFLSNNSVSKRGYVQKEIKEALDAADKLPEGDIFIIPVRLEECTVPERLSKWQWINIFRRHGFRKLVNALRENLSPDRDTASKSQINAKLVLVGETDHEAMFLIFKDLTVIGRSGPRSLVSPDIDLARFDTKRRISRRHALIFRAGDSFMVKDLGSLNSTIINDSVILRANQTRPLKTGDKISLGEIVLHFILGN